MLSTSNSTLYDARRTRLMARLAERGLGWLAVTHPVNLFYLTGFKGSAGAAILGRSEGILWVDTRYTLQARQQARGVRVIEQRQGLLKAVGGWLRKRGVAKVGYEDSRLTCRELHLLQEETNRKVRLQPVGDEIEILRAIKDPDELERIRAAGRLTTEVYEEVACLVRPGVKESDIVAETEYRMRRKGADGPAFDTIVASGPRSAFPHARAGSKLLQENDLVIFDLGAIMRGYAADMTRTLYLGAPSRRIRNLYDAVEEAQRQVISSLRQGVRAGDVDRVARRSLARLGLARYFTHSTGHGVGLEIHERPRLGKGEKTELEVGCVVTAEPGVYLEGLGGIRVEDTVAVGADGPELLTEARKDRWIIN